MNWIKYEGGGLPPSADGVHMPSPDQLSEEAPDETWIARNDQGHATGCLSLWWRHTARYNSLRTGYIGHFASASGDVSSALLTRAFSRLKAEGCRVALGTINGTTWRTYRLLTDAGTGADFPLDIKTPAQWIDAFESAGMAAVETYCSVSLGAARTLPIDLKKHAAAMSGITVRTMNMNRLDEDLGAIWHLSMQCFAGNPLFTPLEQRAFLSLYKPLFCLVDPHYILLAEDEIGLCGFHFAFPHQAQDERRLLISKTMAVHPRQRDRGLGGHLMRSVLARAEARNVDEVIMAFMHDRNLSARWARAHGTIIRRYAVFGKNLT